MRSFFFRNDGIVLDRFVRSRERTIVPQEQRPALYEAMVKTSNWDQGSFLTCNFYHISKSYLEFPVNKNFFAKFCISRKRIKPWNSKAMRIFAKILFAKIFAFRFARNWLKQNFWRHFFSQNNLHLSLETLILS